MDECTPPMPRASLQLGVGPFTELYVLHLDAHMGQMVTQSSEVTAWPLAPGLRASELSQLCLQAPNALSEPSPPAPPHPASGILFPRGLLLLFLFFSSCGKIHIT